MANGIGWNTILRHLHVSIGSTQAVSPTGAVGQTVNKNSRREMQKGKLWCVLVCVWCTALMDDQGRKGLRSETSGSQTNIRHPCRNRSSASPDGWLKLGKALSQLSQRARHDDPATG